MTEVGPLPRYRRAVPGDTIHLPKLLLQPRDLAILDDVWRYRWLTTSQIALLRNGDSETGRRFVSRLTLTRRLKLLYHHRHLQRIARPVARGSQEPVYVLDAEGARALRRYRAQAKAGTPNAGTVQDEVAARAPSQLPKASALEHLLAVNQFRASLAAACSMTACSTAACSTTACSTSESGNITQADEAAAGKAVGGKTATKKAGAGKVELVRWLPSDAVKFSVSTQDRGDRARLLGLIPDGFFTLRARDHRLFYFLEVDLGSEPGKTLAEKCLGYYLYWQSGGFARDFDLPETVGFRVLFVVPGARRAETILAAVRRLPGGQAMFWTAQEEQVEPHSILKPIFTGVTRTGNTGTTFDLTGVPAADGKIHADGATEHER